MADEDLQRSSITMYQYLCNHIVGTEKTVKTKRMLNTTRDNMASNPVFTYITSGSFGEGLEMKGSDIDIMLVLKELRVHEEITDVQLNATYSHFQIITEDTKPGFVKLLLLYEGSLCFMLNLCVKHKGNQYLSNVSLKSTLTKFNCLQRYLGKVIIHGPCLSNKHETMDCAFCLHSNLWISQASQWIYRSNYSWPSSKVKTRIIEHGVLFVPIGVKGSPNEEVEWRISFSVGEKLLIHSFNHTQLLCYALMKILLKDVININRSCKGLLCSYHIKNILFWVSEETPLSEWTPNNLFPCLMQCLRRLIYCVQYSMCPHYFIPENNMFESKIEGQNQEYLLHKLNSLLVLNYKCVLLSPQLQYFANTTSNPNDESKLFGDYIDQIVNSRTLSMPGSSILRVTAVLMIQSPRNSKHYLQLYSEVCSTVADIFPVDMHANKDVFRRYKTVQCYLAQGLYHGAVTGWLKLATLFYQTSEYNKALIILSYVLSKCTQEKIYGRVELPSIQRDFYQSEPVKSLGLLGILRIFRVKDVTFTGNLFSALIPELKLKKEEILHCFPPVFFAHFLCFLCHYHLGDVVRYTDSIRDLQVTISENFFMTKRIVKGSAYICLGIAFQLVRDKKAARKSFWTAVRLDAKLKSVVSRLSRINWL